MSQVLGAPAQVGRPTAPARLVAHTDRSARQEGGRGSAPRLERTTAPMLGLCVASMGIVLAAIAGLVADQSYWIIGGAVLLLLVFRGIAIFWSMWVMGEDPEPQLARVTTTAPLHAATDGARS